MNQEIIQAVLKSFLQIPSKNELNAAPENVSEFIRALQMIEQRYSMRAPLDALFSNNPETFEEHEKERNKLLDLLKACVPFDAEKQAFSPFDKNQLHIKYHELYQQEDSTKLRLLHTDPKNLGIQEKFLLGKLEPKAWLTDLDLKRLLVLHGLEKQITVTRLDATDIGMTLHFARKDNIGKKEPYTVRMILNKGSSGDITSQGAHWIETTFTVDPTKTPPKITVHYSDSLPMSDEEKTRIDGIIHQGLIYQERDLNTAKNDLIAFPQTTEVKIEVVTIDEAQHDAWSCGYRALQNALTHIPDTQLSEQAQSLRNAKDTIVLRNAIYKNLLRNIKFEDLETQQKPQVSKEQFSENFLNVYVETIDLCPANKPTLDINQLENLKAHQDAVKNIKATLHTLQVTKQSVSMMTIECQNQLAASVAIEAAEKTLDQNFLPTEYQSQNSITIDLDQLFPKKSNNDPYILAAAVLKLCNTIRGLAVKKNITFIAQEDTKIPPSLISVVSEKKPLLGEIIVTLLEGDKYSVSTEVDTILIDFENFLQDKTNKEAALDAFVAHCNENKIKYLVITNFSKLSEIQVKQLDLLSTVSHITFFRDDQTANPSAKQLIESAARNRLMQFHHIPVTPEEPAWFSYYAARFSNKTLLGTSIHLNNSIFDIYSGIALYEKMALQNTCLRSAGTAPLQGLLDFLDDRQEFFQEHPRQFTYTTLLVGTSYATTSTIPDPELAASSLAVLAKHLSEKKYFPFTEININVPDILRDNTHDAFNYLKSIVENLKQYPHITQLHIHNHDLTKTQYSDLETIFKKNTLSVKVSVGSTIDTNTVITDDIKARYQLLNTISNNIRKTNIEKRKSQENKRSKSVFLTERTQIKREKSSTPAVSPGAADKVRRCKLSDFNAMASISVDVSHQAEKQYQQQTQLQQETQIAQQMQKQLQNEQTTASLSSAESVHLLNRERFIEKYSSSQQTEKQWIHGPSQECHYLSLDEYFKNPRKFGKELADRMLGKSNLPNGFRYLTQQAASKLLDTPQHFLGGVNFDNLPPGFFVQKYTNKEDSSENGYILCYDAIKFVENKNQSLLTLNPKAKPKWEPWMGDWQQFVSGATESLSSFQDTFDTERRPILFNENLQVLQRNLQLLMNVFDVNLVDKIKEKHGWCLPSDTAKSTEFTFSNPIEIFSLMDILYHEGAEGLEIFLNTLAILYERNSDLYLHFKSNFFTTRTAIGENKEPLVVMEFMSDENLSIIRKLADMTPAQITWWKKIVECEKQNSDQLDLEVLYNGFQYFLSQLPPGISLPMECPLTGCNPLIQLDRLLAILGNVDAKNLSDQLLNLSDKNEEAITKLTMAKEAMESNDEINVDLQKKLRDLLSTITLDTTLNHLLNVPLTDNQNLNISEHKAALLKKLDQLIEAQKTPIDLSCESAWYATRWDGFRYVHPKMKLTSDAIRLSGTSWETNYHVDYQKLQNLATQPNQITFDTAAIAFHRFVGRSDGISVPYNDYVRLITLLGQADCSHEIKIKLLPLLALSTTGPRGSVGFDATQLFQFVKTQQSKVNLIAVLDVMSEKLNNLIDKPTIAELIGVMQIALESEHPVGIVTQLLDQASSDKILQSWALWAQHDNHLAANQFVELSVQLQKKDSDQFKYLSRIIGILRTNDIRDDAISSLSKTIETLKNNAAYQTILPVLASIDLTKTLSDNLPTITQFQIILNEIQNTKVLTPNEALLLAQEKLPDCVFNRALTGDIPALDLDRELLESIEACNATLTLHKLEPFNVESARGEDGVSYIAAHYQKLMEKIPPFVKNLVTQKISEFLKNIFLQTVAERIRQFPALAHLKKLYSEPTVTAKPESIKEELSTLQIYAQSLGTLFDTLTQLNKQWNGNLKLDFLINSPIAALLTPAELSPIFQAISKQKFDIIPTVLLQTVFPLKRNDAVSQLSEEAKKSFLTTITDIINVERLLLKYKTRLIASLYNNPTNPNNVRKIIRSISELKNINLTFTEPVFQIFANALNNNVDLVDHTMSMLSLTIENQTALSIILECFSKNDSKNLSDDFKKLVNSIFTIQDDKKKSKILTILSYSAFRHDYDSTKDEIRNKIFDEDTGLLVKLSDMNDQEFNDLFALFEKAPRPNLASLLALIENSAYLTNYLLDPPGLRQDKNILIQQFEMPTIHQRIDALVDLKRGSDVSLFRSDRQILYDGIGYIMGVGKQFPILIPGDGENKYSALHKFVKDLTGDDIKLLIKHYRSVISNKETKHSPEDVWIAKLEFTALMREAMYRTTGRMAYDTQILSLLNVMLQGGNVFSEIRTGEGKSIITALIAAFKWAEDGAVDVCSSNMVLAQRDLEEQQDFYDYLGINTALIRASSSHNAYQQDGINYSDISELSLWQEQQLLLDNKLPDKVSLIADEVDFNVLDNTTQFRYATSLDTGFDEHFNPYEGLYPHILNFVSDKSLFVKKRCSPTADIQNLRTYINNLPGNEMSKSIKEKFNALPDVMLDRWIDSAFIATQLRPDVDYAIRQTTVIRNEEEISVSQAQVKLNFRTNPDSRFSDGVHQFLHTLMNQRMKKDPTFAKEICKNHPFLIEPEKTYLASRSAKNTIDYYLRGDTPRGNVLGLTGTLGDENDRAELARKYQAKCYKISPHKTLLRERLEPKVAENHFDAILASIKEARKKDQCVLIVCDGVESSNALYNHIKTTLGEEKLQLYNGEQLHLNENEVVKRAAEDKMITISTPMFGRGTDIKPKGKKGLHVVTTYLSDEREYGQNIGRAGRNGASGTDQLIISTKEFSSRGQPIPFGLKALNQSIKTIRQELSAKKAKERYERERFGDIKDQFFKQFTELCKEGKTKLTKAAPSDCSIIWKDVSHAQFIAWESFLKLFDTQKNEILTNLNNDIAKETQQRQQEIEKDPSLSGKQRKAALIALPQKMQTHERKMLEEKLVEFTQFINNVWTETHSYIVSQLNNEIIKAHEKTTQQKEAVKPANEPALIEIQAKPAESQLKDFSETQQSMRVDLSPDHLAVPIKPSESTPRDAYLKLTHDQSELRGIEKLKSDAILTEIERINESLFKANPITYKAGTAISEQITGIAEKLLIEYARISRENGAAFAFHDAFLSLCHTVARYGDDANKKALENAVTHVKTQIKPRGLIEETFSFFKSRLNKLGITTAATKTPATFDSVRYQLQQVLRGTSLEKDDLITYHRLDTSKLYSHLLPSCSAMSSAQIILIKRTMFYAENIFLREHMDIKNFQFTEVDVQKDLVTLKATYQQNTYDTQIEFKIRHLTPESKTPIGCNNVTITNYKPQATIEQTKTQLTVDIDCAQSDVVVKSMLSNQEAQTVTLKYGGDNQRIKIPLSELSNAFKASHIPQTVARNVMDIIRKAKEKPRRWIGLLESLESKAWRQVQFDVLKNYLKQQNRPLTFQEVDLLLKTADRCKVECDLSGLNLTGYNFSNQKLHKINFNGANLTDVTIDQLTEFKNCTFDRARMNQFKWQQSNRDGSISSVISATTSKFYTTVQDNTKNTYLSGLNSTDKGDAEKSLLSIQYACNHSSIRQALSTVYSSISAALAQPTQPVQDPINKKQTIVGKVNYRKGITLDFTGTDLTQATLDSRTLGNAKLINAKLSKPQIQLLINAGYGHKIVDIDQNNIRETIQLNHIDLHNKDITKLNSAFIINNTTTISDCTISNAQASQLITNQLQNLLATVNFDDLDLSGLDLTTVNLEKISKTTKLKGAKLTAEQAQFLLHKKMGLLLKDVNLEKQDLTKLDFKGNIKVDTNINGAKITADQAHWLVKNNLSEKLKNIDLSGQNLRLVEYINKNTISNNTILKDAKLSTEQAQWLSTDNNTLLENTDLSDQDLNGLDFTKLTVNIVKTINLTNATLTIEQIKWLIQWNCAEKLDNTNLRQIDFSKLILSDSNWFSISLKETKITSKQATWFVDNNHTDLLKNVDLSNQDLTSCSDVVIKAFTNTTNIANAKLTGEQAIELVNKNCGALLKNADLSGQNLTQLDFNKATITQDTNLQNARLSNIQIKWLIDNHLQNKVKKLNLSHTDLKNLDLSGIDLTETNFHQNDTKNFNDQIILKNAKLTGEQAIELVNKNCGALLKNADLSGQNLTQLDFNKATITQDTNLQNARLSNIQIKWLIDNHLQDKVKKLNLSHTDLKDLDLRNIDLTETNFHQNKKENFNDQIILKNAKLTGEQAIALVNNNYGDLLKNVDLSNQDLRKTDLEKINKDTLETIKLTNAIIDAKQVRNLISKNCGDKLQGVNLSQAILENVDLKGANIRGAKLGTDTIPNILSLSDVKIDSSQLRILITNKRTDYASVDLSDQSFSQLFNFCNCDFNHAKFDGADLSACTLTLNTNTNFFDASFKDAKINWQTLQNFIQNGKENALAGAKLLFTLKANEKKELTLRSKDSVKTLYDYFDIYYKAGLTEKWPKDDFHNLLKNEQLTVVDKLLYIIDFVAKNQESSAAKAFDKAMFAYEHEQKIEKAILFDSSQLTSRDANSYATALLSYSNLNLQNLVVIDPDGTAANSTTNTPQVISLADHSSVIEMCRAFLEGKQFAFPCQSSLQTEISLTDQLDQLTQSKPEVSEDLKHFATLCDWVNKHGGPNVIRKMPQLEREEMFRHAAAARNTFGFFGQYGPLSNVPKDMLDVFQANSNSQRIKIH